MMDMILALLILLIVLAISELITRCNNTTIKTLRMMVSVLSEEVVNLEYVNSELCEILEELNNNRKETDDCLTGFHPIGSFNRQQKRKSKTVGLNEFLYNSCRLWRH